MHPAHLALAIGAFGIGLTEFVVAGILPHVSSEFGVDIPTAGLIATVYALGVFVGAPLVTVAGATVPRKKLLLGLTALFTIGNVVTAIAPTLPIALAGRLVTALNHGTFFGVGSIIAASLVPRDRQASAIAFMFSGLTLANLFGVPAGTWLAQAYGWRLVFWAISLVGVVTAIGVATLVPPMHAGQRVAVRAEIAAFRDPQVLLSMGITVFGPAAFFTSITYIAPMMLGLGGMTEGGVAVLMILFGLGLAVGDGRTDRSSGRSSSRWPPRRSSSLSSGKPHRTPWSPVRVCS